VYFQSSLAKQLSNSHIAIHHSHHQVTINPHNGKKERVFVDLRAVYPTPEEPGTELSFEELWAASHGWLDMSWESEVERESPELDLNHSSADVDRLCEMTSEKLVVHQDTIPLDADGAPIYPRETNPLSGKLVVHRDVVPLDENGAPIYPRESKPKKKKVMEVNETQISQCSAFLILFTNYHR
jgi:checkpoint serine/threonine-protein kinase